VRFEVPRKGTSSFQADLYPDTAAAVPAQRGSDYFSGKNSNPRMMKMDTKAVVDPAPYEPYEPVLQPPLRNLLNRYPLKIFAMFSTDTP
jgi:hypothetical protein